MKRAGLLAAAYTALTILLAYPLSVHPASRVMSDAPDVHLTLWALAWDVHAFVHQPFAIFDANIFYPERHTLAYSENFIGSAIFAAPIVWITGNLVLAMNLVVLGACVLCGLGTNLLCRRVGVSAAGSFLAGLVFAFAPPRFLRLDQVHLATIEWMPFALAFFHTYLDRGSKRDLRLALGFFSLQALTSGHGAVFLAIAMGGLLIYRLVRGAPLAVTTRLRDVGIAGALRLLPAVLTIVPYVIVQHQVGLKRTLDDWAIPASSFLESPTWVHQFLLSLIPAAHVNETAAAYLFPGCLPLILGLCAFIIRDRRDRAATAASRSARVFYALLFVLTIWLAIGPPLSLWPYVHALPGMNFIRVPSRFTLLGLLALAVLAGIGFDRVAACVPPTRTLWLAIGVGVLFTAECAAMPLAGDPYRVEIPSVDRWLATQPGSLVVAEVPQPDPDQMGPTERRQTAYMLNSTLAWWKTVHGYSGFVTPARFAFYQRLARFPDDESIRAIKELGVTDVVVHTDDYAPDEWARVAARLTAFGDALVLVHTERDGRVYRVVSTSHP